jgi:MFS family permease
MRLWPIFIFWGLWFINFSTRTVFVPILPLIEDSLSLSHGQAGGLFPSLSIGYCISLLIAGRFASAWGHKRLVVSGFVGIAAMVLLLQWANSYLDLHVVFFLAGIVLGTYLPAMIPIITEMYDYKHWGKAIGLHDSAASFTLFTTPLWVAFGLHFLTWRKLLLVLGIASLLLPIYFWKIAVEPKRQPAQAKGSYLDLFKTKAVWIMGLLWSVANGSCNGIFTILPLYLVKERGIEFGYANTLIGISRAGGIFATIIFGFLADRYGYRRVLRMCILSTGLGTIGIAVANNLSLLVGFLIFQAIVSLGFFPAALAASAKLTSTTERGMVTGIVISFGVIFGTGMTPFLIGTIADHSSFRLGILGMGLLTSFSTFLVSLMEDRRQTLDR